MDVKWLHIMYRDTLFMRRYKTVLICLFVAQQTNCAMSWTAWGATWACHRWAAAAAASGLAAVACCASPPVSRSWESRHLTIFCRTTSAPSPKRTTIFSNGRSSVALSHRPWRDQSTGSAPLPPRPHHHPAPCTHRLHFINIPGYTVTSENFLKWYLNDEIEMLISIARKTFQVPIRVH